MDSGVYQIKNTKTGKVYIGSSIHLHTRLKAHLYALRSGRHHSAKLQRSWRVHGEAAFEFKVLFHCQEKDVLFYEQTMLDAWKPHEVGYNIFPTAGSSAGFSPSAATVAKLSATQRAKAKRYDWRGQSLCLIEIAELEGLSFRRLMTRVLEKGWSLERAVVTPIGKLRRTVTALGRTQTSSAWAKEIGIHLTTLSTKLSNGACIEDLVYPDKRITVGELARINGLPQGVVRKRLKKGWSAFDVFTTPPRHRAITGLKVDDVRDIRQSTDPGIVLAEKYGISPATVSDIRTKKTWRHVV